MVRSKGGVPPELAQRLIEAGEAFTAAHDERNDAILDALRAGASVRDVGALVGMTAQGVFAIAKARGWPSEAEQERRRLMNTDEHRFDHLYPKKWAAAEAERKRIAKEHERQDRRSAR